MRRKDVKKMLPIIQGYAEGKTIQWYKPISDEWVDIIGGDNINLEGLTQYECAYRIKPEPELEPKYRPFKNAEECWNECLKHQPFGYVKSKETLYGDVYHNIISVENDGVLITNANKITDSTNSNFVYMFNAYEFIDDTPFGVKIEDKQ